MAQVNVTIAGRTYRMACDTGQEDHLLGLATQINGHIETLRANFGDVGDMRLIIMASLVMADELHEAKREIDTRDTEIKRLNDTRTSILGTIEAARDATANTLEEVCDQIETLADALAMPTG